MKKALFLVEKPAVEKIFKEAIPDIICMSIGGHAYTDDERILNITEDDLIGCPHVNFCHTNGVRDSVYILGSETVNENCRKIMAFLKDNDIDVIVNACDFDKNGDYLFKYAVTHVMKLNTDRDKQLQYCFERMEYRDLTVDHLRDAYDNILF